MLRALWRHRVSAPRKPILDHLKLALFLSIANDRIGHRATEAVGHYGRGPV
ncbi:MAG: hypothetical protein M2R46_05600 [Verrucomicrobia subdivision 3 bacterium]|nr:hypothetical protein [Limisphaerales bacterium]